MLRLRCYLFGKMIREKRDRNLSVEERDFLDRHRMECIDCRIREATTGCSLDILKSSCLEAPESLSTKKIAESVESQRSLRTT